MSGLVLGAIYRPELLNRAPVCRLVMFACSMVWVGKPYPRLMTGEAAATQGSRRGLWVLHNLHQRL
jgi:hypothetical protein